MIDVHDKQSKKDYSFIVRMHI